jgi:hypothetical protein
MSVITPPVMDAVDRQILAEVRGGGRPTIADLTEVGPHRRDLGTGTTSPRATLQTS